MVTLLDTVEDYVARRICRDFENRSDALLEVLHTVQKESGYLSDAALRTIAKALNISRAEIHGVVSFYHDFKRSPAPKLTLKICRAEACQAVGADKLISASEEIFNVVFGEASKTVGLEAVYCLGNCALGPAILVDDKLYGRVDSDTIQVIASQHLAETT